MVSRKEYETTNNRSVYNKLRKSILEKKGEISCSWCGYHRGENSDYKFYNVTIGTKDGIFPNWKLVSKNRKQWMDKSPNLKMVRGKGYYSDSLIFKFKKGKGNNWG